MLHKFCREKLLRPFCLLLLITPPIAAQAQFQLVADNGSVLIDKYDCSSNYVSIPAAINGLPVVRINDWAFGNCTDLAAVVIPANLTNIGGAAFTGASHLNSITVDPLNPTYSSTDGVLFTKNRTSLLLCPQGKSGSYVIPASVTNIGNGAFANCKGLTSIVIGNSVTSIGSVAFQDCSGLSSVSIPASVSVIGPGAFGRCAGLTNVVTGNGRPLAVIEVAAFSACTGLLSVTIGSSIGTIQGSAFEQCTSLRSIVIPIGVSLLGQGAFARCIGLTNVTITDGSRLSTLGALAFYECSNLTSVAIGTGVKDIGIGTFTECAKLNKLIFSGSVTNIGNGAFAGCTSLTNIVIPKSVIQLGNNVFNGCGNLAGVYFEGNAPSLGASLFLNAGNPTVYYLSGTIGWGSTFGGRPTALWSLPIPLSFSGPAIASNLFGFAITGNPGISVVVESSTTLSNPFWAPVATNTLTGGSAYFSDPQWTNYPSRVYRLRVP